MLSAGTGCGAVTGGLSSVLEGAGGTSDFSLLRRSFASNSDDSSPAGFRTGFGFVGGSGFGLCV